MFTVKIDISAYGEEDEIVEITTHDFNKVTALQKFIEFMEDHDWDAEWGVVKLEEEEEEETPIEDEE